MHEASDSLGLMEESFPVVKSFIEIRIQKRNGLDGDEAVDLGIACFINDAHRAAP